MLTLRQNWTPEFCQRQGPRRAFWSQVWTKGQISSSLRNVRYQDSAIFFSLMTHTFQIIRGRNVIGLKLCIYPPLSQAHKAVNIDSYTMITSSRRGDVLNWKWAPAMGEAHLYILPHLTLAIHPYLMGAAATAKSLQSCPTLCDPVDSSPPGSAIPGILQARTLEWVAISFSSAWKWKVKVKLLNCVRLFATPWTVAHQAPLSMGFSRQEYWSGLPFPSPS